MARRQGSIVGCRDGAPFAALQTALYSFAKSIAREFAPAGIRINCLGPIFPFLNHRIRGDDGLRHAGKIEITAIDANLRAGKCR
jgi:NAD(P)-dependent dehydrogenase (short-subunit alcohol dehydrogenase family)